VALISLGITLALGSWAFQTWTTTLWLQQSQRREQIRQAVALAKMERDMWLIEYNAGQLRFPQNQRVMGRAALHLFENTRELLALREAVQKDNPDEWAEIWAQRDSDVADARKLFDEGNYSTLNVGLARANEQYESGNAVDVLGAADQAGGLSVWQHALPWTFLVGMLLCLAGAFTGTTSVADA
jgi:hypothetical protein